MSGHNGGKSFADGLDTQAGARRTPQKPVRPVPVLLWDHLQEIEQTDRLVRGLIGETALVVIYGEPGSGKSFLGLDLGLHVALGWPWFNRETMQGAVLFVAAEGQRGVMKRIAAFRSRHIIGDAEPPPFALLPEPIDLVTDKDGARRLIDACAYIKEKTDKAVAVVEIDTLARCFGGGNENDAQDMGRFLAALDKIRVATGATIIVVHHVGKDSARGMRGHSALRAAADTAIEVTGLDGIRTATIEKQKDGEAGKSFTFRLESVTVAEDDAGAITSCVVSPSEATARPKAAKSSRLPPAARIAREALQQAIAEAGEPIPASNHVPAHTIGAPIDLWRRFAYQRSISKGDTDSAQRKAFQRAAEVLQANEVVKVWSDWAWIP